MKRGLPKHGLTRLLTGFSLALLLVASTVGANVTAEEPADQPPAKVVDATSVSFVLHYQGQLLNPATGAPKPDGDYSMIFKIYSAPTGGTALWTESKNVPVVDGLFSTLLGDTAALDPAIFTGQDLWLGVTVGTDPEATPRQRIAYSAYAMYALNADTVDGQHAAGFAAAGHNHDAAYVNDDAGEIGNPDVPNGALAPEKITGTAWTSGNMGAGSGLDADTLDGKDSSAFAAASHTHTGTNIVDGSIGTADLANGAVTSSKVADGSIDDPDIRDMTRYIPITPGDLMHNNSVSTGDCCNGITFPDAQQTGGPIVFALPSDYVAGTNFNLDLYFIPLDTGSGQAGFFVRWVGLSNGSWSGTGSSATSTLPTVGTINYVHKQSFTLNGFSAGSLPDVVELNIRRDPSDTYPGNISLIGIRLAYQASR